MILYSENYILKLIDFNETIPQFAKEKARKKFKLYVYIIYNMRIMNYYIIINLYIFFFVLYNIIQ